MAMAFVSTLVLAAAAAAAPTPAPAGRAGAEPAVEHRVVEDEQNRIEELKVRGETRRVVVSPKREGVKPYEITPPSGATDTSQQGRRGGAGERVWRLFSF